MPETSKDYIFLGSTPPLVRRVGDLRTLLTRAWWRSPGAAFLAALFIGLVAECFGSVWIAMFSIVAYVGIIMFFHRQHANTDNFADGLYYLGFIFTLFALFLTMQPWSDRVSSDDIVRNFGMAMATTLLGMALRVIVLQVRRNPLDLELDAQQTLQEHVAALNKELETTLLAVREFHRRVVEEATSAAQTVVAEVQQAGEFSRESIERSAAAVTAGISEVEAATKGLAARIGSVDIPTDIMADRLRQAATVLAKEMNAMQVAVSAAAASLSNESAAAAAGMRQTKDEISGLQEAMSLAHRGIEQAVESIRKAASELGAATHTISQGAGSFVDFQQQLTKVVAALAELGVRLETVGQGYRRELKLAGADMRAGVQEIRTSTEVFTSALVSGAEALRDAVRGAKPGE